MILELQLLSLHPTNTNLVNIVSKLFAVPANGLFLVLVYYGTSQHLVLFAILLLFISEIQCLLVFCLNSVTAQHSPLLVFPPPFNSKYGNSSGLVARASLLFSVYSFPRLKYIIANNFQIFPYYLVFSPEFQFCVANHLLDRHLAIS